MIYKINNIDNGKSFDFSKTSDEYAKYYSLRKDSIIEILTVM